MLYRSCMRALAVVLISAAPQSMAQSWKPERPLELIVGSTPGGALDRTGRTVQRVIQERKLTEQPLVVVNKPGGGGTVGLTYLSQQTGDGHRVMITGQTLLTNHILGRSKLTHSDFTPLAILSVEYVALSVRADSAIPDARALLERLRKNPAAFSVAVGTGIGTATQASFAHAMHAAGVDVTRLRQVAFGSGGESMTALLGGHVDALSSPVSSVMEQLRAGRIRVLAVGAPQRLRGELSTVPVWNELGVKSAVDVWRGVAGPKGMSGTQIAYWDALLGRVASDRIWTEELERTLSASVYKRSAETLQHWQEEYAEMTTLYTALGVAKK